MILSIEFSDIPFSLIISITASAFTLLAGLKILKYQVSEMGKKLHRHKEDSNKKFEQVSIKFKEVEDKHEELKDSLVEKINDLKIDVSRILTILNQTNKSK